MTFTVSENIRSQVEESLGSADDLDQVINTLEGEGDGQTEHARFIHEDVIDNVMQEELKGDPYVLGCFNAAFVSRVTGWPVALIEAAQQGEAYGPLGETLINENYVESLAKEYALADGYGHHFNSWDGSEDYEDDFYIFNFD